MRKFPDPIPNPETEAFWSAAAEGRFLLRRCRACDTAHWYPRAICPHCQSDETEWVESAGDATIYSFTVVGSPDQGYALAYVELAEGPRMLTNIVSDDLGQLTIGQSVRVQFRPSEGGFAVPIFAPRQEPQ